MVAVTTSDLGYLDATRRTTDDATGSIGSRDRDDQQRIAFLGDPTNPFSGKIHIQGTVSRHTMPYDKIIWFDIIEADVDNEGGNWSVQFDGEFMSIRAVIRDGNLHAAAYSADGGSVSTTGTFTINGISINVNAGDDLATVAATINSDPGVIGAGNIKAEVKTITGSGNVLKIYTTDGTPLTIADTVNTPLADMGFTTGTTNTGRIKSVQLLR